MQLGHPEAWEGRDERELELPLCCFFWFFPLLLENLLWRSDFWIQVSEGLCFGWHVVGPLLPFGTCRLWPQWRVLVVAIEASFWPPLNSYYGKMALNDLILLLSLHPCPFSCCFFTKEQRLTLAHRVCADVMTSPGVKSKCVPTCSYTSASCQKTMPGLACWREAVSNSDESWSLQVTVTNSDESWSAPRLWMSPAQTRTIQ